MLERQGENICVPELFKKIKLMGRRQGVGEAEDQRMVQWKGVHV